MKITIYELLGMIKDDKVPKKIRYNSVIIQYNEDMKDYERYYGDLFFRYLGRCSVLQERLDNEVEILEEEKKIPEKLNKQHFHKKQRQLANKINEIIDYLKSKGE